jgi:PAS domain-containing protein
VQIENQSVDRRKCIPAVAKNRFFSALDIEFQDVDGARLEKTSERNAWDACPLSRKPRCEIEDSSRVRAFSNEVHGSLARPDGGFDHLDIGGGLIQHTFLILLGGVVLALALLMLAVVRQVAALLENLSLTTHLELRVQERTAELDRSEQRFRSLVQNSSDVITVVDGNGIITYQSPSIGRVLGHESTALLDTSYFDLVHLDDHADLTTLID